MNRIDTTRFGTEPAHADIQIELLQILTKLVITVQNREPIIRVLAGEAYSVINNAIVDLRACGGYDKIKSAVVLHPELIDWLQKLDKTLQDDPNAITLDRLERGRALVAGLDTCRTSYRVEQR